MSRAKRNGKTVSPHKLAALNFTGKSTEDTPPPESLGGQEGALSCIMQEANQGGGGEAEMLDPLCSANFRDPRCQEIYAALLRLQHEGKPLNILWLNKMLPEDLHDYARSILETAPSPAQFPVYLDELKKATVRYEAWQFAQYAQKLSNDPNRSPATILADLQERMRKVTQSSLSGSDLPSIENIMDFMARDIPKPPELIEGLLHQGSKMLISGGSKSFKTWTLFDLSLSVASGTPFLGLPTTQAKVLFLNLELQDPFSQDRSKEVFRAKGLSEVRNMEILNLRGHVYDIKKLRQQVMPRLLKGDIGLVIIDPIYKIYGDRDENSVSDIASLMYELECICREGKCAVVFAAHQCKGNQSGKESIDRISGSGAFARDVDSGLIFTAHSDEWCYTADASILRNFPPLKPFVVRWEYPLMVREDDLNPEHLKPQRNGNPPKHHSVEEIMAHVPHDKPIDKNELREKANKAKIGVNKINPLIEKAIKEGLLYEHLIRRPGTNHLRRIARYPQEQQQDLHDSHDLHA